MQQGVINIFIDYIIYFHSSIWAIFSSSFSFALLLLCRDLVQYLLTSEIDFRSIKCGAKKINFHLCANKQEEKSFFFLYLFALRWHSSVVYLTLVIFVAVSWFLGGFVRDSGWIIWVVFSNSKTRIIDHLNKKWISNDEFLSLLVTSRTENNQKAAKTSN